MNTEKSDREKMSTFEQVDFGAVVNKMKTDSLQGEAHECRYYCQGCHKHYLTEQVLFIESDENRYWGFCEECQVKAFLKRVGFSKNYHEINLKFLENKTNSGTLQQAAHEYLLSLDHHDGSGIVVCGSYGTYKTHFLSYIARLIYERNQGKPKSLRIHYFTVPTIIERYWQNKIGGHRYLSRLDVIMLDDFGGYLNEPQAALFDEISEILYSNCVSILVTTNLKPAELEASERCRRTIDLWREKNKRIVISTDGFRGKK